MIRGTWNLNEPLVPVNIPGTMVRLATEKGIEQSDLLANTEIEVSDLSDPQNKLTYQQVIVLTNNLLNINTDPGFGLELGETININQYGMVGYAIMSSANLRKAIELGLKYHTLIDPAFTFSIHELDDYTSLRLTAHIPIPPIYELVSDIFLANFVSLAKFLTGQDIAPHEIHINRTQPEHYELYQDHFDCPVLFDQPRTAIIFPTSVLEFPHVLADEATARMAEAQCEEFLLRLGPREGIVTKVRRILLENSERFPDIESVASELATSTRTLSRSLQELGTSYQKILDEVRKEIAIELLKTSTSPIEDIAEKVGYNDPSNFRKAFKRWTGNPPSYYRSAK